MSDAEAISTPCEPGGFVGDIYFGHPLKSTMGTHRWSGSEWVALPSVVEALAALLAVAKAERDRLREALEQIAQWSDAYPTEVFPEPDFAQATAALASSGMSIDAVSASNMRHATKGVGKIARAALKGESHE
tara:strand:+ start:1574 stop:1969 length:396 start_codon:yes stop_codon:yes gene_type:complete